MPSEYKAYLKEGEYSVWYCPNWYIPNDYYNIHPWSKTPEIIKPKVSLASSRVPKGPIFTPIEQERKALGCDIHNSSSIERTAWRLGKFRITESGNYIFHSGKTEVPKFVLCLVPRLAENRLGGCTIFYNNSTVIGEAGRNAEER